MTLVTDVSDSPSSGVCKWAMVKVPFALPSGALQPCNEGLSRDQASSTSLLAEMRVPTVVARGAHIGSRA